MRVEPRRQPWERDEAFRPTASGSGLLVPAEYSREREVWTDAEQRSIDRAMKLLKARGLLVTMRCEDPRCQQTPMQTIAGVGRQVTLRCNHKDRVLVHAF